jgi:hypothetical protein
LKSERLFFISSFFFKKIIFKIIEFTFSKTVFFCLFCKSTWIKGINKMSNTVKLLSLGIILLPFQVLASSSANELTKDDWLGKLKQIAPTVICKGFFDEASLKKRMDELKMDNEKCLSLIPASFDKCQTQYYSSLPDTINQQTASKWGHTIGECIGTDFATKHLVSTEQPATSSAKDSSADIPKDKWLSQLRDLAPTMICNGFFEDASIKKKLEDRGLDKAKCVSLIPISFDKCQTEYYSTLPNMLSPENTNSWGHKLGECIGTDFAKKYFVTSNPTTTTTP